MIRMVIGSLAGAVAMFVVGFLFFATPLQLVGLSTAGDAPNAAIQVALAQNLPGTGTYVVPSPMTAPGAVLYGKGPIAVVHYNSLGFSSSSMAVVVAGFVHEWIVALILGFALLGIAGRVTDFASRMRLLLLFSVGASALTLFSDPIWMHQDWRYAIYSFVGSVAMLAAAGIVIARWFLPNGSTVQ
ncbi:hypothetical protein [Flavisphingomonas formosensis]|uniref:hypothetical protein n=1 Tax=Flavisphingomonas formosensis TaxID=861534 RepID=UPI0012FB931F|nr:hypothetical protein [Sphingomonas formosensis]